MNAAELDGFTVREVGHTRSSYGYVAWDSKDHLVIDTGETRVGLRVSQHTDRSPHAPTTQELDRQRVWGPRPPKYDHTPNEWLRIEIGSRWDGRPHSWRDGTRASLDEKLPALLDEIAHRHEEARERRIKAELAEVECERQRQIAVEQAKVLLRESHRAEVLNRQAADWRRSRELREYVCAMETVVEKITDPAEKETAGEWASWARVYADDVDPLRRELCMPDEPEPTAEALRPFLRW